MSKPIAFIIGAGKNIGLSTAATLQSKGYRIALAARSLNPKDSTTEILHLALDLSKPEAVGPAFASLREQWGEPSVVFYNGEKNRPEMTSPFLPSPLIDVDLQPPQLTTPPLRPTGALPGGFRHRSCYQHHQLVRCDERVPRRF